MAVLRKTVHKHYFSLQIILLSTTASLQVAQLTVLAGPDCNDEGFAWHAAFTTETALPSAYQTAK